MPLKHPERYYKLVGPFRFHTDDAGLNSCFNADRHSDVIRFGSCRNCGYSAPLQITGFGLTYKYDGNRSYVQVHVRRGSSCRACMDLGLHNHRNGIDGRIKRNVYSWMKSLPCSDCGRSYLPEAMEFDHLPGHKKLADVSDLASRGSLAAFIDEIEKCDVVCAICHRIRERDRRLANAEEAKV